MGVWDGGLQVGEASTGGGVPEGTVIPGLWLQGSAALS